MRPMCNLIRLHKPKMIAISASIGSGSIVSFGLNTFLEKVSILKYLTLPVVKLALVTDASHIDVPLEISERVQAWPTPFASHVQFQSKNK